MPLSRRDRIQRDWRALNERHDSPGKVAFVRALTGNPRLFDCFTEILLDEADLLVIALDMLPRERVQGRRVA